ncbi:pancreatic triacylglycerol lipase-like [Chrysoperla carnea]|uniref:pancreatic triacylglycerol lipase-like n=2 Tax=Chrysoperla carnea TaxID=189513 RepID=UPI001D0843AD|nr:pancreatic triacylglycerol lipase-like [Chrysoperla carnea]
MEGLALSYIDSVRNSSRIGTAIGELLAKYVEEGMPLKTIHVVGYSLGGHIVSFIGKAFKQHFNNELRLPRITALDPAGPIFVLKFCPKLEKGDADMVDVIHTDTNLFGYPTNLGYVDYYPNMHLLMGGQPGCSNAEDGRIEGPGCSHYRSWKFYSESVLNPTAFPSVRCINKYAFLFNYCDNDSLTYMGYLYPDKGNGEYYLETGPRQPFGMEMDGIPNLPIEIYDFDEM